MHFYFPLKGTLCPLVITHFAAYNFGNKSDMRRIFFYKSSKFDVDFKNEEKKEKIFWVLEKIAFELIR